LKRLNPRGAEEGKGAVPKVVNIMVGEQSRETEKIL
jgi:hypothetical protein